MKCINGYLQTIRDRLTALTSLIGSTLDKIKKRQAAKNYESALASFDFTLDPHEAHDRIVVVSGNIYRVFFSASGIAVRNELNDENVTDRLLICRILRGLTK